MSETHLRVTVTNIGPTGGIGISPAWVGFHDGNFDPIDFGASVPEYFERLNEDANLEPITSVFSAYDPGNTQGRIIGDSPPLRGLAPGMSGSTTFTLDGTDAENAYASIAWMLIPTNDAFWINDDPRALRIFDADGNFISQNFVVRGQDAYDAGTEINTEALRDTAALGQLVSDTGPPEGGVVTFHPGLLPLGVPGPGGVLDDERYAIDFASPEYKHARVTIEIDGDETIGGSDRPDRLDGGFGNDTLFGRAGRDNILGGDGDDYGHGGDQGDLLVGGNGNDMLYGGFDTDRIEGGAGDDTLFGGQGGDTLLGDEGNDLLTGGRGADLFIADTNQGDDRILLFNISEGDRIALGEDGRGRPYSWGSDADGNLVLELDGSTVTLVGIPGTTSSVIGDDLIAFF